MFAKLWAWLCVPRNQKTLGWLGGGVIVLAGAVWKFAVQEPVKPPELPSTARPAASAPPASTAQDAKAESGGIAANARDQSQVSIGTPAPLAKPTPTSGEPAAPPVKSTAPTMPVQAGAANATATEGGVAVNASGAANVKVQQSKP